MVAKDRQVKKTTPKISKRTSRDDALTAWESELARLIDKAARAAKHVLLDPKSQDASENVTRLLDILAACREQLYERSLPPSDGTLTLGIGRYVSDWVDDLNDPLNKAVRAVECHYLSATNGDPD